MSVIRKQIKRFITEDDGQALSEYALVLAVIAIAVITVLTLLRNQIIAVFQKIADAIKVS